MVGKTKRPSAAERRHLDAVSKLGCVACAVLGVRQPSRTECHHILSGGRRIGHMAVLPLDSWHHRGVPKAGLRPSQMEQIYGPSLALNKRAFVAMFGTERELLLRTNARLVDEAG